MGRVSDPLTTRVKDRGKERGEGEEMGRE